MNKSALITGIAGQDGSYLAALLLKNGYIVHGVVRGTSSLWRHDFLNIGNEPKLHQADLTNYTEVTSLLSDIQPDEIYHLAAQSSVAESKKDPYPTLHFNTVSTLTLLEATKQQCPTAKFFHASSCEIFGSAQRAPLSTKSLIAPSNPYGVSKASAHLMVCSYRENLDLFAVNGILFPHESPLRHEGSLIKSIIRQAVAMKAGTMTHINLGQIENERDFGSAPEFVNAMWQSLQVDAAADYIIGTGIPTTIRALAQYITDSIGVPRDVIVPNTHSAHEPVTSISADPSATTASLGWSASQTIYATIDAMIEFELTQKQAPAYDS